MRTRSSSDIRGLAGASPRAHDSVMDLRNYAGGAWQAPAGETMDTRNPANGSLLARVPLSHASDVDAAVDAALAAQPAWGDTSPLVRARAVFALRGVLDEHREELAQLVTRDMGKTYEDALAEVGRGIESVEAACGGPAQLRGRNLHGVATGVDVQELRQPLGVVAAITPFNFPAMIPLWFLPYAVVCGNAFILKPSELDPITSNRIFELIDEHSIFPPGVVNLVHGAHDAVNSLLEHPDVDAISFVGSATTGRYVYERAAAAGKRVQALAGAKNALVVMPDADPRVMVNGVLGSAFGAAGQRCLAGSLAVLVGTPEEQDESRDRIVEAAARLRVGDGLDPGTDVGPLITPDARERVEAEVERGLAGGARVVLDGRRGGGAGGAELGPTILDEADDDSHLVCEEQFGPVLTLIRQPDLASAVEWVNRSRYGNASVIFTASGVAARTFKTQVHAGMVGVNVGVAAPVALFPFSGWKDSFDGDLHANGDDAFRFYTRAKVVTELWR
jgi:malonate-semialdehyde dehydrogenase (acetylating)/methylmalonate-semialdehyde dehydrogenase